MITASKKCHRQARPKLEVLEDRLLMSVFGSVDWKHISTGAADDYPYSAAVSIYRRNSDGSLGGKIGSGAMVGPNTVLTAAHVIYDTDTNSYRNDLLIVPGQVGDFKPFGAAASTAVLTVSGYTQDHADRYDVGLIYLDRNLGSFTGSFGLMQKAESFFDNRGFVNILHYPSDSLDGRHLVYSKGNVSYGTNEFILYNGTLDTEPGSSGSPVYVIEKGKRYIVGVHHQGHGSNHPGYNQAVRIDDFWFNTIVNNKNLRPTYDYPDLMDRDAWFNKRDSSFSVSGTKLAARAYIWNGGTAKAGPFQVHFYASTNTTISGNDHYLGSVSFKSLKAFQSGSATLKTTAASNLPAGSYYIGWMIDGNGSVSEYRENNNTGLVSYKVMTVGGGARYAYVANESAQTSSQPVSGGIQYVFEAAPQARAKGSLEQARPQTVAVSAPALDRVFREMRDSAQADLFAGSPV